MYLFLKDISFSSWLEQSILISLLTLTTSSRSYRAAFKYLKPNGLTFTVQYSLNVNVIWFIAEDPELNECIECSVLWSFILSLYNTKNVAKFIVTFFCWIYKMYSIQDTSPYISHYILLCCYCKVWNKRWCHLWENRKIWTMHMICTIYLWMVES